jgi:hypothetical protein
MKFREPTKLHRKSGVWGTRPWCGDRANKKERTSAAKAGNGSVLYGTAEAVPFQEVQETEFSRRLFSPCNSCPVPNSPQPGEPERVFDLGSAL